MATKQQLQEGELPSESPEAMGEQAMGPAFLASAASVGLSLYYYFVRGDQQRGLFIGLWPPTILAFASYFNQRQMRRQLETITEPGSAIKSALDSVMGSR